MLFEIQSSFGISTVVFIAFVGSILSLVYYCTYQRVLSPLAKYPGPFWASLTDVWFATQRFQPQFHRELIRLHETYGPIVRVKPNKLMIASPEAFKIIYSAGKKFTKGEVYIPLKGKRPFDLTGERDEHVHGQQRRLVSQAYTMETMKSLEPYVDTTIKVLLKKFEEISADGQAVDFAYLIQLFAFDVIGEVTFAKRFGYLDALSDFNIFRTISAALFSAAWVGEVPWVYNLHQRLAPYIGNRLAVTARNGSLHDFAVQEMTARKDRAGAADDHDGDILSKLLVAQRQKPQLSEVDIGFMLTTNVVAGSDTTSVSLCAIVYYLLTTPRALDRLMGELQEKVASGEVDADGVVTQKVAESWPYLQAVILEGMRLHPALGSMLSRVVPKEGLRFDDHYVPPGYEVGTSAWVIHRNSSIFGDDVESFRPERWLDEKRKSEMHRYFFAFGGGSRTCIGKNISMLEMSKVIPTIFKHFELRLAPGKERPQERYGPLIGLKPLHVVARKRTDLEENSM
ncbi:cytochrome p450 family protein [Botryosphaeria dothidea]|uniref:Cytochrome p450 family protein n=1 Tax=Botryosphaeria dothidea TaxID=55169 RepID=A0A8H4IWB3_9PEZI|nr:cytochrome p450 family protein [Botryosphaeria dothidea]